MWIQIPSEIVEWELTGIIAADTTLAYAAFMIPTMKTLLTELPTDAQQTADELIQTGRIVTSDGEILTLAPAESQSDGSLNPASASLDNDYLTILTLFKNTWPDELSPDQEQIDAFLGYDLSLVQDVVTILEASDREITSPPKLALWYLRSKPVDRIREEATIVRRKISDHTFIDRAIKESDRKMREAPKPEVTPAHIQRLEALKEKLRG